MPLSLPLYKDKRLPVEAERPRLLDHECTRCKLNEKARNVCLPAVGEAGGVLLVGDSPSKHEDAAGEPFSDGAGRYLKNIVKHFWKGPVAFDKAVRCPAGKKPPNNAIDKCRPYLTQTLEDVEPSRIIVMGPKAAASFFGQKVPVLSARHGIGWVWNKGKQIPVFILVSPAQALHNTFLQRWFEKDLKWALTCDLSRQWKPPVDVQCNVATSTADVQDAIDECYEAGGMTYDVETVGRVADRYFNIISLAMTPYDTDDAWVIDKEGMKDPRFRKILKKAFADSYLKKTGTNVKYDHECIEEELGVRVLGTDVDIRLQRKMLYSDVSGALEDMAYLVGMGGHKMEMARALTKAQASISKARTRSDKAVGFLPGIESEVMEEACKTTLHTKTYAYGLVDEELLYRYNALDSVSTERMRRWLVPQMQAQPRINAMWRKLVSKTTEAVVQVERWGMPVDRQSVLNYDKYLEQQLLDIGQHFKKHKVSPGSDKQMRELLYKEFGLPVLLETDTGLPSVAAPVLTRLSGLTKVEGMSAGDLQQAQRIVNALLEHNAMDKLKGTYASGMLDHIRDDGRIHPSLNLDGASTGRTSCSNPNLQNIPRDSNEHARIARGCFIAAPGRRILQLDYSQLEYRIAAMMSGDPVMIDMFMRGLDFHTATAQLIAKDYFGVNPEDITKEMRSQAKTFNFGLLFGMTDNGLAARMGCTRAKAAQLRAAIMGKWAVLRQWIADRLDETQDTGFAWTWWDGDFARRRPLWRIGNTGTDDKSKKSLFTAGNATNNTPIQGTASDYCIASLVECVDWLVRSPDIDAKLVVSVHDSLMFDVAEDDIEEVAETAHDIMCAHDAQGVPIVVDIEQGASWGSLEKMSLVA